MPRWSVDGLDVVLDLLESVAIGIMFASVVAVGVKQSPVHFRVIAPHVLLDADCPYPELVHVTCWLWWRGR